MTSDPIVLEIHKIREENCKLFDYDLRAIFKDINEKEKKHNKRLILPPARERKQQKAA